MLVRHIFLPLVYALCAAALACPNIAGAQSADSTLQSLAGEYSGGETPDLPLSFYEKDGKLFTESERQLPAALKQVSATKFVRSLHGEDLQYVFSADASGRISSVAIVDPAGIPAATLRRTGSAVRHDFPAYERTEAMVPMRDGVKLYAVILKPLNANGPLPFLMQRTPYGVEGTTMASLYADRPELARGQYIYVAQDIRGRYKSQGEFVMSRPINDHSDSQKVDESTDAYDTVTWLLANVPGNNGRVGVLGTSYPGFLAMASGIDPHPAVKAISPQAPMIDVWMGDDYFHNGAFRQGYGYDYVIGLESSKERTDVSYGKGVDGFDYFLERGSFAEDVKRSAAHTPEGGVLPTWKLFLEHPAYDETWSSRGVEHHLASVTVPTLSVGGYYDQEDLWGPQEEYGALEPHDAGHENFLVLGPWRHGSWASSARHLGAIQYGAPIGMQFRKQIEAPFFAHYLKNESGFDLEDTASFQTGSNVWRRYSHFPPVEATPTAIYLGAKKELSWQAPEKPVRVSYVADPKDPVPYRHRPIQPTYEPGSKWGLWMTEDQRFVSHRKDVALWKIKLDSDLTVTGEVVADLFLSTSGTDEDVVVKLIDEYPSDASEADPAMQGYQLMTNAEIFRGRYLKSFAQPEALGSDEVREFKYSLHAVDHLFKRGHTLVVEVQSSWFPLYDRNPQTFVSNIMTAAPADYVKAKVTIVSDEAHRSKVILPVVKNEVNRAAR